MYVHKQQSDLFDVKKEIEMHLRLTQTIYNDANRCLNTQRFNVEEAADFVHTH